MNRGQLRTEILDRLDRSDSRTIENINNWIDRIVQEIEKLYPFGYLRSNKHTTLTPANNIYTLPDNLILQHPFELMLKSLDAPVDTYTPLLKLGDKMFDIWFPTPGDTGDGPEYYILRGGTGNVNFQVYPVQTASRELDIKGGYYYTGAFTDDSNSNYLTDFYANAIIEGVSAKAFEHYGETQKADRALQLYTAFINGDPSQGIIGIIQAEKKIAMQGKVIRVKTFADLPLAMARKIRYFQ